MSHRRRAARPSLVQSLEARRLLAAVSWDGGGDGTTWTSAANWSTDALPTAADDVTINIAANPTIRLNGANAVINSLSTAELLNLDSGTLAPAAASSTSAAVTLSGATLAGAGTFTLNGGLTWSGGNMRGTGKTVVPAGTTSVVNGGADKFLVRPLEVAGTLRFDSASTLYVGDGSQNAASALDVVAGGAVDLAANPSVVAYGSNNGFIVRTGGTLTKSGAGASPVISVPIGLQGGTVQATTGTLSLATTITATGGTLASVGTGLLEITGGTLDASGTLLLQNARFAGGTLTGTGVVTANALTWTGGNMRGTGKTVVPAGTTSVVNGGADKFLVRPLEVAGTLRFDSASTLYVGDGLQNAASTLDVVAGGAVDLAANPSLAGYGSNSGIVVRTGGTLTKSGAGASPVISVALSVLGGTVQATAGTLSLATAVTGTGGTIAGVGTGLVEITGGTLDADGTLLQNARMSGGTVIGGGTLTVSNLTWTGGSMRGAGKTVFAANTISTVSGGADKFLVRKLEVAGTLRFDSASVTYFGDGSQNPASTLDVVSGGTVDVTASPSLAAYGTNNGITVRTGATLTKSAGNNTASVSVPVNLLGGTIGASAGILSMSGGGTSTGGTLNATSPGVIEFSGGTQTLSGTLAGTGTGVNRISGGTVAVDATATLQTLAMTGGILSGTGVVTINALTWTGGAMRGTGKTVVAANTTSTVGGGADKFLVRKLEVAGTLRFDSLSTLYFGDGSQNPASTLDVVSGGAVDLTANPSLAAYGTNQGIAVRTGGTLTKSGTGASPSISVPIAILGGTVRATAGTLSLNTTMTATGGTITGVGTGVVAITGGTLDVSGTLLFQNAQLAGGTVTGSGTVTASGLTWTSGAMRGTGKTVVAVNTTSTLTGGGDKFLVRTMEVAGTLRLDSASTFYFGDGAQNPASMLDVLSGGTVDLTANPTLAAYGQTQGITVRAGGTLTKSAGNNTASVSVPLSNFGTVESRVGTLYLGGTTNIGAGTFLSTGRYLVASGAILDFPNAITTLTADLEIDGTGSVPDLVGLRTNRGRVGLTGGADVTLSAGNYVQEGILDLSPGSVFTVNGNLSFAGTSQPVIRSEIASAWSFGRVVVSGVANLDSPSSTSRLDPDLVGAYDPPLGTTFAIVTGNSVVNAFDSFQGGLTPGGNVLEVFRPNAQTYGARIVPGPLPPAPQILSQTYEFLTRQAVTFQFNQDVSAFLSRKDFTLVNLTTGQTVANNVGTLSFNQASNQSTLLLTNQLANGNYRLTVNAPDIANAAGVPASGSPIVLDFFVLAGDVDRNRVVDFNDFVILQSNFGQTGRNVLQGNVNYDGLVNFDDFVSLQANFGLTV